MIKSYVCIDDKVVTKGDKDIESIVPYYDNIGARFVVQNEIEFLSKALDTDEKRFNSRVSERESRFNYYKKLVPITGAVSVGAAFVFSIVSLIGNDAEYILTSYGNFNPYVGTLLTTLPASIIVGQIFASLELVFCPSKREIAGLEEMVKYEKETLENKRTELASLECDTRKINRNTHNTFNVIKVDDSNQLRRHKENFRLRYAYGAYYNKILEMYKNGTLLEIMKNQGFGEEAMSDFMIYFEQTISLEENSLTLAKKDYK